ncbi:serine hydrolase domain-containing protein [Kitasatospora sp. McL0602]|uniref:serine hydrolase domain-containing protein n=1 Tax=Kitasatospora sp. McL0602 TaxID=3439530 RepID=UPI003F8BC5DC
MSKRHLRPLGLATAAALAAALGASLAVAAPAGAVGGHPASTVPPLNPEALSAAIALRPTDPAAGVVARVTRDGEVWRGASGDVVTGTPTPADGSFHIGSIAKTFEATVLLQLEAEHRVDLDGTVQHYLPGLLPDGYPPVTVRQLLDHTSGLPQIGGDGPELPVDELIAHRFDYRTFDEIIQATLRPPGGTPAMHFTPGTRQEYNSLGYRIAGRVIEQVTGHSFKQEVTARVLAPLRLAHTTVPESDTRMPRRHLHGYLTDSTGRPVDVSEQGGNPSNMISTPADLDHFITALVSGRLLPPAQQTELFALPQVPYFDGTNCSAGPDHGKACFSAGLMKIPLPDGSALWGKTGHDFGYASGVFTTRDTTLRAVYSVGTTTLDDGQAPAVANRLEQAILTGH